MSRREKINLTQICEEFAPVFKLSAEGLTHLGVHFETERRSVLMPSSQLAGLAEALAQFALTKRDEFLGINPKASAGQPLPRVRWLPADDTEGGSI